MKFYRGRLFDHVHLMVADLDASKRFYKAALESLGRSSDLTDGPGFFFADELFVSKADGPVSSVHLAFQAKDQKTVRRFYQAALAAGGRDNGKPGERSYHAGYYAAYVWILTATILKPCFMIRRKDRRNPSLLLHRNSRRCTAA